METLQPARPVLSYEREETFDGKIIWREDGVASHVFIVPPPSVWRLVVLPAIGLSVITPIVVCVILFVIPLIIEDSGSGALFMGALLALLFAATWFLSIKRLVHVARHGRKAFVLHISPHGFSMESPYDNRRRANERRPVVNVNLECLPGEFPIRMVVLRIAFTENEYDPLTFSYTSSHDRLVYHIPWPDRQPLQPWEDRLFEALAHCTGAGAEVPAQCEN